MNSKLRTLHHHLACRLAIASAIVLTLLPAATAYANCMRVGYLPVIAGETDPGDGILLRLIPDREDLVVNAQWSAELHREATFILSTPSGVELMSWTVERAPGKVTEHRLPDALSHVSSSGFQFRLRLAALDGETPEVAFRVAADCPTEDLCTYRLLPGLEGGLTVSQELWSAIDEARGSGSEDLLAEVQAQHPDLASELPGFSWQLQESEPTPVGECRCRWLTVEGLTPKKPQGFGQQSANPPLQDYGSNLAGGAFYAMLQGTEGAISTSQNQLHGQTTLGLQLLCTRNEGSTQARFPTAWPSLPELEVEMRRLATCPAPCTPTLEHETIVWGCAQATAAGRGGNRAAANAGIDVALQLGTQSLMARAAQVNLQAKSGQVLRDIESNWEATSATLSAEGASATLVTGGSQAIDVEALGGRTSYAFTSVSAKYHMKFLASASCAEVPDGAVLLNSLFDGTHEGGVAVEQWEDP
ncbi:MAG: hypothetical protein AAF560_09505 [Acidobacteriota bacterium]